MLGGHTCVSEQEGHCQLLLMMVSNYPSSNAKHANTPFRGDGEVKGKKTQTKPSTIQTSDFTHALFNTVKRASLSPFMHCRCIAS